jgi:acyl-CoA synthetase (NDP forming)
MVDLSRSVHRVASLLEPRNIVVIGASDKPGSWPATVWNTVRAHGFTSAIYAVNPNRDQVGDARCYRSVADLPEPPDHVVILTPAPHVPDTLTEAAKAGARSATVYAAGYGEDGSAQGHALAARLKHAIETSGIVVQGPNCTGNIIAKTRLVTLVDHRALHVAPGPVALVGQSGGVLLYANHILADRGIQIGALVSSGNEIDLSCADYIAYFADDPATSVIFCYLESVKDAPAFKSACRRARDAGKPVIVFKIGASEQGREAAMTHTGALAGSTEVFDAVMGENGVVVVKTLDQAIEAIELVVHLGVPLGRRLGALSLSGAYRGILVDAASGSGLTFPKLAPHVETRLAQVLATGSSAGNPADGGFTVLTSVDKYVACVSILCDDPNLDLLLLQAELPREEGMAANWEERFQRIHDLVASRGKKLAFISMFSRSFTEYSRAVRARLPHVAFVQETTKSVAALAALADWSERAGRHHETLPAETARRRVPAQIRALHQRARAAGHEIILNERESKDLLAAYGLAGAREIVARTADEAAAAAQSLGFPVVLKALSDKLLHKSEIGAVLLDLADEAAVRRGVTTIAENVRRAGFSEPLEGLLVCEQVRGGTEIAFGARRDAEMGGVAMAGSGGILLELMHDVCFAALPLTPAEALKLIERTRVARLLRGYRGARAHDMNALARALLAVAQLAEDLDESLSSIDVNPVVSRPNHQPVALDAVIVLRGVGARS